VYSLLDRVGLTVTTMLNPIAKWFKPRRSYAVYYRNPCCLSVTRCMVSRYVDEYISPQLRASVMLLLELLFIRDGSFSCSLLSPHDIGERIDTVCRS